MRAPARTFLDIHAALDRERHIQVLPDPQRSRMIARARLALDRPAFNDVRGRPMRMKRPLRGGWILAVVSVVLGVAAGAAAACWARARASKLTGSGSVRR